MMMRFCPHGARGFAGVALAVAILLGMQTRAESKSGLEISSFVYDVDALFAFVVSRPAPFELGHTPYPLLAHSLTCSCTSVFVH